MLALESVSKVYRHGDGSVAALDHVSLEVAPGDFVVITGRSGSGKTTLLAVSGGLTRPDAGRVRVDGVDLWSLTDDRRTALRAEKLGFVFQFASLVPTLTVLENVLLPTAFLPARRTIGARARALELLERVGLSDKVGSYPWQLSGGQQKRVAVARALLGRPALLLADEPTGDLDEETEADIVDLFRTCNAAGTAVLMVTHNTQLAAQATRHLRMSRGRLHEAGDAEARSRPA
ncbi:ABC transporter ATP-binding protein [Caldinitratiruptor microaerophilus]|uniref:ABC transporter ATP-binding protein n=1 Tax=Caldinitratiruptor microaerophilus TaxID=671077 RepID=UPI00222ED9D1|nr:ABC transporter ATP-binding protein [Caldinitratiruptor microaerophilus]